MLCRCLFACVLVAAGVAETAAVPIPPARAGGWTGKKVMLRQGIVRITGERERNEQKALATLTFIAYVVEAEQDGWLRVTHMGITGWFEKQHAIPADEAVAYFTEQVRNNPADDRAYALRAWAWKEQGNTQAALDDYAEAIRLQPQRTTWFNNRGVLWRDLHQYDKALADFNEALRLSPAYALALSNRGHLRLAMKEYDEALNDFNQAIKLEAKNPGHYNGRGRALLLKKEYDQALADFEEALKLDPGSESVHVHRAQLWAKRKEYGKALADCDTAIHLKSASALGYNQRAWLLATCPDAKYRDGARAVEAARRACQLSSWKQGSYIDTLAAAYAAAGDFMRAVQYERQALAVPEFAAGSGADARKRLALYEQGKAYTEE